MTTDLSTLLNKSDLCAHLSLSPRAIENMVKAKAFPPPVRIGKHVYWSVTAVQQWQQRLFAAQEAWTPGWSQGC
ncbi:MAG: helix-turn-helix domain-containing protein [Rhodoferax sp.]|jgi:prophage regulatory protein|uniref:helix-turn-helix transcriptional regulator n=1 Tax=Rhodoferax sp. TaxID=50421 RepID=UPI00181FBC61|nr:helix-turn-helix domain-containing protein [Rhodoferax sp.]NMM14198.1 helix-turn-helix domain-containing protein [Rhodoferax sp.]NMM19443.1 helix-turn-helix domain-containing protein [Rhodoferax sp.]